MRTRDEVPQKEIARHMIAYVHDDTAFARSVFAGEVQAARTPDHETAVDPADATRILDDERATSNGIRGIGTTSDSIFVAGDAYQSATIARYSRSGDLLWSRTCRSGPDAVNFAAGIAVSWNSLYVVGYSWSLVDLTPHTTFFRKYDLDGNLLGTSPYGGADIIIGPQGDFMSLPSERPGPGGSTSTGISSGPGILTGIPLHT